MPELLDLAWLLGCLDHAARLLHEIGSDVDALVIEAHRAELAAGRNWPGMRVTGAIAADAAAVGGVGSTTKEEAP